MHTQSNTSIYILGVGEKVPFAPSRTNLETQPKIIATASTFKFIPKNDPIPEDASESKDHGIPPDTHWVDWAQPGTVVLIEQPAGQYCAALGGIMAARMKVLGVKAAFVNGRVRDLAELRGSQLQVSIYPYIRSSKKMLLKASFPHFRPWRSCKPEYSSITS